MSSRKGKVAGDREEKVAGDGESNREEKRGKKVENKQRGKSFICFGSVDNDKLTKAVLQ